MEAIVGQVRAMELSENVPSAAAVSGTHRTLTAQGNPQTGNGRAPKNRRGFNQRQANARNGPGPRTANYSQNDLQRRHQPGFEHPSRGEQRGFSNFEAPLLEKNKFVPIGTYCQLYQQNMSLNVKLSLAQSEIEELRTFQGCLGGKRSIFRYEEIIYDLQEELGCLKDGNDELTSHFEPLQGELLEARTTSDRLRVELQRVQKEKEDCLKEVFALKDRLRSELLLKIQLEKAQTKIKEMAERELEKTSNWTEQKTQSTA